MFKYLLFYYQVIKNNVSLIMIILHILPKYLEIYYYNKCIYI